MNKKQFEALVNKGAITHVGIAADVEKLSDKELCEKFVTKHEVAAEVLSGEDKAPEEVAPETPSEPVALEAPAETVTPVEETAAPVALAAEEPVATTTAKKSTKKTAKKDVEVVDEAPVVDPVVE